MRIGIIRAGQIGGTLAKLFVDAGHEVAVSNSRGPETLAGLVDELGGPAQATTAAEAERFGDVVVVSVPFGRYRELPTEAVAAIQWRRLRDDGCPAGGSQEIVPGMRPSVGSPSVMAVGHAAVDRRGLTAARALQFRRARDLVTRIAANAERRGRRR